MGRREPDEGRHDSPHRAEQPDERAGRAGGGQEGDALFELAGLDVGLPAHRARHVLDPAKIGRKAALGAHRLAFGARELEQFLVAGAKHLRDRAARQADAAAMNRGEILGFPEERDEAFGLAPGVGNLVQLIDDDAPAHDREERPMSTARPEPPGPFPAAGQPPPLYRGRLTHGAYRIPLHPPVRTQPDRFRCNQFTLWPERGQITFRAGGVWRRLFDPRRVAPAPRRFAAREGVEPRRSLRHAWVVAASLRKL